jgi:hypothetical protein
MEMKDMDKKCETCKWHDEWFGVCCNGTSPHCADFTGPDFCCKEWKSGERINLRKEVEEQLG